MNETNHKEHVLCPQCEAILKVPHTSQILKITCPCCHSVFFHNVSNKSAFSRKKAIWGVVIVSALIIFAWLSPDDYSEKPTASNQVKEDQLPSDWITISYGGLLDKMLLTHSGEKIGTVISQIPIYNDEIKGLIQPYLEPFSILCHDVLLSVIGPDTLPFVNIMYHYPVGSEQPAWASLFREGHYQLYYNRTKIRVFVKGMNAIRSFDNHRSVIKHAIKDVIQNENTAIDTVEVYVFTNNYTTTEIMLNTIPATYSVDELSLEPIHNSIDLMAIEEFLKEGVILEACEVDDNNDLFFFGRKTNNSTLAGSPLSLADIAVVYRSVFHYGYNSPYISLDKHEDNRFAKVNFGGHLENTHVGNVVLEADKLFKSLGTGLDPNTHKVIRSKITRNVPSFLTEDERSLLENSVIGQSQIRYWFYPDSIGTVTDGSIGAVLTHQFLADVERMDMPISASTATRNTISHLNRNYGQYESVFETFRELSTVGRIMSLVNWLKGMDMGTRVELDELLTVKIPAFTTPDRTKKMLAITAVAYPKITYITSRIIRDNSKVYYISDLLDKCSPTTSDKQFLEMASAYYDQLDIDELAPPAYMNLKSQEESLENTIAFYDQQLESLDNRIRRSKQTVNKYSSVSIDQHNELVNRYNELATTQKVKIHQYNIVIDEINRMNLATKCITSIGGGINLRPKHFKRISRSSSTPIIRKINSLKGKIKSVGKIARSGNWIRSNVGTRGARVNDIPVNSWNIAKSIDGTMKYDYSSVGSDRLSVTVSEIGGGWKSEMSINGSNNVIKYSDGSKSLQIMHSGANVSGIGIFNSSGKRVVFSH